MNDTKFSIKTINEKKANNRLFKTIAPAAMTILLTLSAASALNAADKKQIKQETIVQTAAVPSKSTYFGKNKIEQKENIAEQKKYIDNSEDTSNDQNSDAKNRVKNVMGVIAAGIAGLAAGVALAKKWIVTWDGIEITTGILMGTYDGKLFGVTAIVTTCLCCYAAIEIGGIVGTGIVAGGVGLVAGAMGAAFVLKEKEFRHRFHMGKD